MSKTAKQFGENSALTNNEASNNEASDEERLLKQAILRLNGNILGLVLGIVAAVMIFVSTNWLILKGGPDVGRHLSLLGEFYIGYSVSFYGSLIGMMYGFVTGYIAGFLIAWIYNRIVMLKVTRLTK